MTYLTAEEAGILELGKHLEIPANIRDGGFCFHQSVWFVSGRIPNIPEWSSWTQQIGPFLHQAEYLSFETLFETSDPASVRPLEYLRAMNAGVYLIQLLDIIETKGHWVALETASGLFDPGTGRKGIELADWIRYMENRFRVRRVLQMQCSNRPASEMNFL